MGHLQRSCGKCGGFGCPWPSRCAGCGKRTPGTSPRRFVVELQHRHHGRHEVVKSAKIFGRPSDYVSYVTNGGRREPVVDEAKLLRAIPDGLSPVLKSPQKILLMVEDVRGGGSSTAVAKPTLFRPWGKYFDAWSLNITRRSS